MGVCKPLGLLPAVLIAIALPSTGRAQFADCAAPGYLGGVDDRMRGAAMACDEAVRFTIATPGGSREVRIIHDSDDAPAGLAAFAGDIRSGIERAATALMSIGEGAPGDITVWASGLAAPEDAIGITDAATRPVGAMDGECAMAIYPGDDIGYVVAHEFFHCVQYATYGAKTDRVASTWWAEGSAEWFANLAYPGTGNSDLDVAAYDSASAGTALTSMAQESVVFFFWLGERFGASMVMALMAAMPDGNSETAQQDALAGLLSESDFQAFAQDYLDRTIQQPGGRAIPSTPFPGNIYPWSESRSHDLSEDRFVLARAQLEFACGAWSIARSGESGTWKVSLDDGPWDALPEWLSVAGEGPDHYRLAAFGIEADGFAVTIEATRDPCQACGSLAAGDDTAASCLVGTWNLVSGGYGERMDEMLEGTGLYETVEFPDMESVLVINGDGTYSFPGPPEDTTLSTRSDSGDLYIGIGTLSMQSSGQWSVDGDTLTLCETFDLAEMDITVTNPDGVDSRFTGSGGSEGMPPLLRYRTFSCTDSALTLVEDIPFTPTTTWQYQRAE